MARTVGIKMCMSHCSGTDWNKSISAGEIETYATG